MQSDKQAEHGIAQRIDLAIWLTLDEMASYTGYSKSLLSSEIRAGCLRAISKGNGQHRHRWRARREWIDAWLEGDRMKPHEAGGGGAGK